MLHPRFNTTSVSAALLWLSVIFFGMPYIYWVLTVSWIMPQHFIDINLFKCSSLLTKNLYHRHNYPQNAEWCLSQGAESGSPVYISRNLDIGYSPRSESIQSRYLLVLHFASVMLSRFGGLWESQHIFLSHNKNMMWIQSRYTEGAVFPDVLTLSITAFVVDTMAGDRRYSSNRWDYGFTGSLLV